MKSFYCTLFWLFSCILDFSSANLHLGLIHSAIEALHSDGNISIGGLNPHFTPVLLGKAHRLPLCLNSQIGDEEVDLFNAPLKEIIHKYMSNSDLLEGRSLKEIGQRVHILAENLHLMAKHIVDCVNGEKEDEIGTTKIGLTKFSHLSPEEMKMAFKGGLIPDDDDQENQGPEDEDHHHALGHSVDIPDECTVKGKWSDVRNLPESFDYRDQEVVSPVKNQGFCGSCWLFAALAGIESAFMLKYKEVSSSSSSSSSGPAGPSAFARMAEEDPTRLEAVKLLSNKSLPLSFSEMYTMDCLRKDHYRDPCEGGQPAKVFGASLKRGTVLTESADPYVPSNVSNRLPQSNPNRCTDDSTTIITRTNGYCRAHISKRNDDRLKQLLISNGPLTAAFRSPTSLADGPIARVWGYLAGPLNTPCNSTLEADHLMLLVGWTPDYWLLKNSYGVSNRNSKSWGVEGYVYLNRSLAAGCGLFGNGRSKKSKKGDGLFTGEFTFPFVEL